MINYAYATSIASPRPGAGGWSMQPTGNVEYRSGPHRLAILRPDDSLLIGPMGTHSRWMCTRLNQIMGEVDRFRPYVTRDSNAYRSPRHITGTVFDHLVVDHYVVLPPSRRLPPPVCPCGHPVSLEPPARRRRFSWTCLSCHQHYTLTGANVSPNRPPMSYPPGYDGRI